MANTTSAKKAIRQIERRTLRNKMIRTRVRSSVRIAREAIVDGDLDEATELTRLAARELDKAANKSIIHRNNASRRKGRLFKALAALEAEKSS